MTPAPLRRSALALVAWLWGAPVSVAGAGILLGDPGMFLAGMLALLAPFTLVPAIFYDYNGDPRTRWT